MKKYTVILSPFALTQLDALYDFIAAKAGHGVARNYVTSLQKHCESFRTFPKRGTKRDDIRAGLRLAGYRRRVTIAFSVTADKVIIEGLFYGGQDVERLLTGNT